MTEWAADKRLGPSCAVVGPGARLLVLCTDRLNQILSIDAETAMARVQAGVSLDQLMRAALPLGLRPTVTPGTGR